MEISRRRRLRPCPNCAQHIKTGEATCHHCGALLTERGLTTATAALPIVLGLLLAGCNKNEAATTPPGDSGSVGSDSGDVTTPGPVDDDTVAEPMYGVPMSDDDVSEPEYGAPITDDGAAPEPEYGVPMTGEEPTMEPEYGVALVDEAPEGPDSMQPMYGVAEMPSPREIRRQHKRR